MWIHVALGHVLVMLQAKRLIERVTIHGEAKVETSGDLIILEATRLHPCGARGRR
jgi:hypothetical protein